MKIETCYFNNFKNLNNCIIKPNKKINIIYGKNAQGKTNFLEAINLFSGKNFKKQYHKNLINFNQSIAQLKINFSNENYNQQAIIILHKFQQNKNKFNFNGINLNNLSDFYGKFFSVFFSPNSLLIINDTPNFRRKFLNYSISQLQPNYLKYYKQYKHVLNQRNKILKNKKLYNENLLEIFSEKLAKIGTIISIFRFDYIKKMSTIIQKIYYQISNNSEHLQITYKSSIFNKPINNFYNNKAFEKYFNTLKKSVPLDQKLGFTNFGIHKDDIIFQVDKLNLKKYGSQGQKKSCAIALKLTQAKLIFLILKKHPIILLDEVLSELDEFRQDFLINNLKFNQIFISCCNLTNNLKF